VAKAFRRVETIVAGALYGGLLVGLLGVVLAVTATLRGNLVGAGVCLVASGIAFGLLAIACLRG
jgi:hypothetical protein